MRKMTLEGALGPINAKKKTLEGSPRLINAKKKTLKGDLGPINAKKKNTVKRLAWADEVGRDLLMVCSNYEGEDGKLPVFSKITIRDKQSGFNEEQEDCIPKREPLQTKSFEAGEPSSGRYDKGCQEGLTPCRSSRGRSRERKEEKVLKNIDWGDEVGGELRRAASIIEDDEKMFPGSGKGISQECWETITDRHHWSKTRSLSHRSTCEGMTRGGVDPSKGPPLIRGSYKEALMSRPTARARVFDSSHSHTRSTPPRIHRDRSTGRPRKRCFRCLATDHSVAVCRDPVRCLRCRRTGHRAQACKEKAVFNKGDMNRAANPRGREPQHKVFVPYTEEYLRRVELRRNAILADVIEPANLGPNPITVIKTALASRFGGYTEDFAVARCRERDYAIFLPDWVPAEVLIRREILTLNGFWLRCWPWGRYRDARPHRVLYKAWIRLINLPFEIWSVARVAALVSSFGRFIKADDVTKAMTDLRAFRCQIALDSIYNIPQNLSVIVDEELYPVMVHLER